MGGFASTVRACSLVRLLYGSVILDSVIDENDQRNLQRPLLPSIPPTDPKSSLFPSDVPSFLPSIEPKLSHIPAVLSGDPSKFPSDAPSLTPSDDGNFPTKVLVPTASPTPRRSFPLAPPDEKALFPPSADHSSARPSAEQKRDFRLEANDATFVIALTTFIVVCSLAIAGMGLYVIAQKTNERRNQAFSNVSISSGRDCDAGDDDDDAGRLFLDRAETVSSLSSVWKEDLYTDFGVLQSLAEPDSFPSSPMGHTTGDGVDNLTDDPDQSVNNVNMVDDACYDPDQLSTMVQAEQVSKPSHVQHSARFVYGPNFHARPIVGGGTVNSVRSGPHQVRDTWSYTTSCLVHDDGRPSLDSQADEVHSFAASSVTLNSFDQLLKEYEIRLDL